MNAWIKENQKKIFYHLRNYASSLMENRAFKKRYLLLTEYEMSEVLQSRNNEAFKKENAHLGESTSINITSDKPLVDNMEITFFFFKPLQRKNCIFSRGLKNWVKNPVFNWQREASFGLKFEIYSHGIIFWLYFLFRQKIVPLR